MDNGIEPFKDYPYREVERDKTRKEVHRVIIPTQRLDLILQERDFLLLLSGVCYVYRSIFSVY